MKNPTTKGRAHPAAEKLVSEILILPDGKILVHNLSSAVAGVLAQLNPADAAMNRRATRKYNLPNELPN